MIRTGTHLLVTCDKPGCRSYHQSHPNSGDHLLELERWGWAVRPGRAGSHLHFCQAHAPLFADPVPAPHDADLVPPKFPPPSAACGPAAPEPEDD